MTEAVLRTDEPSERLRVLVEPAFATTVIEEPAAVENLIAR